MIEEVFGDQGLLFDYIVLACAFTICFILTLAPLPVLFVDVWKVDWLVWIFAWTSTAGGCGHCSGALDLAASSTGHCECLFDEFEDSIDDI